MHPEPVFAIDESVNGFKIRQFWRRLATTLTLNGTIYRWYELIHFGYPKSEPKVSRSTFIPLKMDWEK